MEKEKLEVWLRGPLPEIPPLLQPVAHALLQAVEELEMLRPAFRSSLLWQRPARVASVGFHLQHLCGVLDRLFTYAKENSLNETQLNFLKNEQECPFADCTFGDLLDDFRLQVDAALNQLKQTQENSLTEIRYVGRAMIPSTHLGLLFHAAEHTQRHVGQLLVTARILMADIK